MTLKMLLAPFSALALLGLAACDEAPQTPTDAQVQTDADAAADGISDALSNLQDAGSSLNDAARSALAAAEGGLGEARVALESMSGELQQNIGDQMATMMVELEERRDAALTDVQKADAVTETRERAEALARAAGLSAEQITEAGTTAENAARRVLGYDGPLNPP